MRGEKIGHIGLDNFAFEKHECVVESLITDQPVPRGLAAAAAALGIRRVFNHVAGSNAKIRLLATAQGFHEISRTPLYEHPVPGGVEMRPMYLPGHDTPDEYFVFAVRELQPPEK